MSHGDAYGLGYRRVDDDPNVAVLVDTMDATSRWNATVDLRGWERRHLRLAAGESLLDVGCGLGDAALALADDLGADGRIVGIDASSSMLSIARERAATASCPTRFSVGDATGLDEPSDAYDAVRCERTLQWLADPGRAVREMARVLAPGGRMSLIDTDWSTFVIDVGDDALAGRVRRAMSVERRRAATVGRLLGELVEAAGLDVVATTSATQRWTDWDPDVSPAPDGCFSMRSLAEDLVDIGEMDAGGIDRFVATIHEAARRDEFAMSLTMYAVLAIRAD